MRGLVVSPATFARHMAAMASVGFRGLSMQALVPYMRGEKVGRVFGITFDDGYENNLVHALPVLQRWGFSSTCYVVAGLVGKTNVWDDEKGIAQVPLMTAEQLQTWVNGGQEVGSHAMSHAMLAPMPYAEQALELGQSKTLLESMVHQCHGVQHFCYPYGSYDANTLQAARETGYTTATTTQRGRVTLDAQMDLLQLPRVLVSRTTSWPQLLVKCLSAYEDRRAPSYAV